MNKDKIGMFPGSFDPIHDGHIDIIKRTSKLFDKLYVVVSINIYKKQVTDRNEIFLNVKKAIKQLKLNNVEVAINNELTIDFAKKHNCKWIVRSIRDKKDMQYELTMAQSNHYLDENIETLLLVANEKLKDISSSGMKMVKENIEKIKREK